MNANDEQAWIIERGDSPLVAAAIHDGHRVRAELLERFALSEADRLREEDPFTARWTVVAPTRIVATHSRFEVDLNRPRAKAVYELPEDAWGLDVWKYPLSSEQLDRSLAIHDAFYGEVKNLLTEMLARHPRIVVLDLHSYNYRRREVPADPRENPEINVGTGTMHRPRWAAIVDRFMADMRRFNYRGRRLDVRENVKFKGGFFPEWIHKTFPEAVCVLSLEFKKFFMDEWTGRADEEQLDSIEQAIRSTLPGLYEELELMNRDGRGVST